MDGHKSATITITITIISTTNEYLFAMDLFSKMKDSLASDEWLKAKNVLERNPSLMTPTILLLALHSKPPLHIIHFMLELNPHAASIPKTGPTALQIAVKHHAAHNVIHRLLQACPFALLDTTNDFATPLELALTFRQDDVDLIAMLSQPLVYWMEQSSVKKQQSSSSIKRLSGQVREIDSIQVIATTMIRAQKRQMEALQQHKWHVDEQLGGVQQRGEEPDAKLIQVMVDAQRKQFKTQLVALDMRERVVKTKCKNMKLRMLGRLEGMRKENMVKEQKIKTSIQAFEEMMNNFNAMVTNWQSQAEERMEAIQSQINQESQVNAYFRKDTRLQLDQMFSLDNNEGNGMYMVDDPIMYATPYVNQAWEDQEPMLPKFVAVQERRKKCWYKC